NVGALPHKKIRTKHQSRNELEALRKDKFVVIKSADKTGAVVILGRHAYETEIQRQLSVTSFYEKLNYNPVSSFKTSVYDSLKQLLEHGCITKAEFEFMWVEHPAPAAYKDVPAGRPVVSAIGSLTEKFLSYIVKLPIVICSYMDYHITLFL
uniref:Uncharacterized protein n=1 Tax=Cyprinus carpio TaxID=7962 RepID=A0A8C1NSD0_CYPCA